jgi:hypothetical protein
VVPVARYRSLYQQAYTNYRSAIDPISSTTDPNHRDGVTGTQILIGELASATRHNVRIGGATGTCATRCTITPVDFIKDVANQPSDPLYANGLAYHPYDHTDDPRKKYDDDPRKSKTPPKKDKPANIGIVNLSLVTDGLKAMCHTKDEVTKDTCTGGLQYPGNQKKVVPLFLTEFGYRNKPTTPSHRPINIWHTETTRAAWLYGAKRNGIRRGVLDNALGAKAKWMLYYTATENDPHEQSSSTDPSHDGTFASFEMGLFGLPPQPGETPNSDIVGDRGWGKVKENKPDFANRNGTVILRKAYCSIRRWAVLKHYPNVTACPPRGT